MSSLRRVLQVFLAVLLLATSLVLVAPPTADAIISRDQERLDNGLELIAALEGWAAVDGDYVVDGAGYNGEGYGWFKVKNSTYNISWSSNYEMSIAEKLVEAGFLRDGNLLPADPSDYRLNKHHNSDFKIYQCEDRAGVWINMKYEDTPADVEQWWGDRDCPTSGLHDYLLITAPLSELVPHDDRRVDEVDALIEALESYASVNGTYDVDGSGYKGLGFSYFFYQGTSSYHNYDLSIANALIDAGHLASADVPMDPQVTTGQNHFNPLDLRVYHCAGRAAVVARTHGTIFTSVEDRAWWEANYEDTTNDVAWNIEDKCPTTVADPDDRVFLKLTKPIEAVYQEPEVEEPLDFDPSVIEVCSVLPEGVPILDPGGFIRGDTDNPRPDVTVSGYAEGRAVGLVAKPDQALPTAYLWVPDQYRHRGSGSISVSHDNFAAGVGPVTLSHYFGRDESTTWGFDYAPVAWVSDWRTLNHPTGKFLPVAGSITDVVTGHANWSVDLEIFPAVSNADAPAPVPCTVRSSEIRAFWSNSVFNVGAVLALGIENAMFDAIAKYISAAQNASDFAEDYFAEIIPGFGCLDYWRDSDGAGNGARCLESQVQFLPLYDCVRLASGNVDVLTAGGCAADFIDTGMTGLRVIKVVAPNRTIHTGVVGVGIGGYDSAGRKLLIHNSVDGSSTYRNPDNTTLVVQRDGTRIRQNLDGSTLTQLPDATRIYDVPNGPRTTERPDGVRVTENVDGTTLTELVDGSTVLQRVDGSLVITIDGTQHDVPAGRLGATCEIINSFLTGTGVCPEFG